MIGYDSTRSGSWGRRSARPTSNPTAQPINQLRQDSVSQQYGPTMSMSSSAFSEASSLYANTTLFQYRPIGGELRRGQLATMNGNNSTFYDGASDFEKNVMLQSSLWYNSQPVRGGHVQTPPGGQGGWDNGRRLSYGLFDNSIWAKYSYPKQRPGVSNNYSLTATSSSSENACPYRPVPDSVSITTAGHHHPSDHTTNASTMEFFNSKRWLF